jgi:hypothetical protein
MAAVAGALLAPASPALAGTVTTQNACRFSLGNTWRHINLDMGGTAVPNPVAPGSGVNLTQPSAHATLPPYLSEVGHELGILEAGDNVIQAKVWIALQGSGTAQGIQTHYAETVAHTTITEDATGT